MRLRIARKIGEARARQDNPPAPPDLSPTERHYTVAEVARAWSLSTSTIQRMFKHREGVVRIASRTPGRRERVILRIPESVLQQEHALRSR